MIQRRKKVQNTQQSIENNEPQRLSVKNRKDALRATNRFSYQLQNLHTDKDQNESVRSKTNYYHQYNPKDKQATNSNSRQNINIRPNHKQYKNLPLKKDYLYQENTIGTLYCSRNKSNYYQPYNSSQRQNKQNVSLQYETTPFNRTPIFPSKTYTSMVTEEFNPHQSDIEKQYQQIWANNQREKQYVPHHHTMRHPLMEKGQLNRQNIVVNTRKSISKNTLAQERSASLRSQQNHQGTNTHRHYNANPYIQIDNSLQTRKTSPTRCKERTISVTQQVTLRSSPNKPIPSSYSSNPALSHRAMTNQTANQTQVNIRLVEEFTTRVSCKISELSSLLLALKCVK